DRLTLLRIGMANKKTRHPKSENSNPKNAQRVERPANRASDEAPLPSSVVGIGASAGGLEAFEQLLSALPQDTGMAFVLVQHLAPNHESILRELLAKSTRMPVIEVQEGMAVRPTP